MSIAYGEDHHAPRHSCTFDEFVILPWLGSLQQSPLPRKPVFQEFLQADIARRSIVENCDDHVVAVTVVRGKSTIFHRSVLDTMADPLCALFRAFGRVQDEDELEDVGFLPTPHVVCSEGKDCVLCNHVVNAVDDPSYVCGAPPDGHTLRVNGIYRGLKSIALQKPVLRPSRVQPQERIVHR